VASNFDGGAMRAWSRLLIAGLLSFALHYVLLNILPGNPDGGAPLPAPVLSARIEPRDASPMLMDMRTASGTGADKPAAAAATADSTKPPPDPVRAAVAPAASGNEASNSVLRDPTYYAVKLLDVYPRAVEFREPTCTPAAIESRAKGIVLILALVDELGVVNEASVAEGEAEGPMQEAFLAAIRAARFTPGQRQGRNVKSRAVIRAAFDCTDKPVPRPDSAKSGTLSA
jgi:TonB family protein